MSYAGVSASGPLALAWMESHRLHLPREAEDVASRSISAGSGFAVVPFLALGGLTTNQALDMIVQFDIGHTNPVISLPGEEDSSWVNLEDKDLGAFLSFLDDQAEGHSEWIEPADEAQLDRLAALLANVKV